MCIKCGIYHKATITCYQAKMIAAARKSAQVPADYVRETVHGAPSIVHRMWAAWWKFVHGEQPPSKEEARKAYRREWMRNHRAKHGH